MQLTDTQRIQSILDHTSLTANGLAMRIGLSHPDSIYHILRGRNGISNKMADQILMAFPEISRGWLLSGEGAMFRPDARSLQQVAPGSRSGSLSVPGQTAVQQVPLYDFEAVAGLVPIFTNQNTPVDYISIPDLPRCDGAVYVRGDSMYPLLKAGDIVIYKQLHDFSNIIWGEMYLISFSFEDEEYITVKFIKRIEGDDIRIQLVSYNQHHAPKEISLSSIRALALVKASIRFNTMG